MKKFYAFFICFFSGWKKYVVAKRKSLLELQTNLRSLHFSLNQVESLARLFQIIHPFQFQQRWDYLVASLGERNYGQLNSLIASLEKLQKAIDEIGADEINQTIPGKKPSEDTIYLSGNFRGLRRRSLAYFLKNRNELERDILLPKNADFPIEKRTSWQLVNEQSKEFVSKYASRLLKELTVIEEWL
jgi:hypothetical protein